MRVRLVPVCALPNEKAVVVRGPRFMIGRADDCTLCVASPFVSRHHCELVVEGDRVCVYDLASRNGTFVNCAPVSAETLLKAGDILSVATNSYRVDVQTPVSHLALLRPVGQAVTDWFGGTHAATRKHRLHADPTRLKIESENEKIGQRTADYGLPRTVGDWLILRSLRSKMCLSPSRQTVLG